jgi:hypothetical protein
MINSKKLPLVDEKYLTNQSTVKVQIFLSWAAHGISSQAPVAHGDRGAGRNIAIQKISRVFRGSFTE